MLEDDGPPKEPARIKAERKWRNHAVERAFKEQKATATQIAEKELEVGDVIENKERLGGSVIRAQTKFAKQIKEMLEGHTHRNLIEYKLALKARIRRLKYEKLKRLEARVAQQNQGGRHVLRSQ
jgi:hypothetical protein